MIFYVRFYGLLGMNLDTPPGTPVPFELPAGATYGDLLRAIGERYGDRFPPNVWDGKNRCFQPFVQALVNAERFIFSGEQGFPLAEGAEIAFFLPLAGG